MLDEIKAVLTATIEPYKQKMEQVKTINSNVTKSVESIQKKVSDTFNRGTQVLQRFSDKTSSTAKQQELLKSKIQTIENVLNTDGQMNEKYRMTKEETIKLEAELENLKNKLDKLEENDYLENLKENSKNVGNNLSKVGKNATKGFESGLKSLKKFSIGLIGVRGTLSLFNKYMGNYLSLNEQASAQNELTTNTITMALAPALQILLDVTQYAAIGFALLVEMLTGTNILSKVTTKNLREASNEASKLGDNLTGLDEIENLNGEGTGTGLASGLKYDLAALEEFQQKIEQVKALFSKFGVADKLEKVKKILKWIWDHPMETLLGIAAFKTLKGLLPAIIGSSGIGLTGVYGLLAGIATIAATAIVVSIIVKGINDLREASKSMISLGNKIEETRTKIVDNIKSGNYSVDELKSKFSKASGSIITSINDIKESTKTLEEESNGLSGWFNETFNTGVIPAIKNSINDSYKMVTTYLSVMEELYNQGKLTEQQQKEYKTVLQQSKLELEQSGLKGKEYKEALKEIDKQLETLGVKKTKATIELEVDTTKAKKKTNNFFNYLIEPFKQLYKGITAKANGGIFVNGTWRNVEAYAGGGNPPMGQYFIAREQGPELVGTIGSHTAVMNNNQIVGSVAEGVAIAVSKVMSNVQQRTSNSSAVFNIDGREFAKAIYPYLNEESQRQGSSMTIRRR